MRFLTSLASGRMTPSILWITGVGMGRMMFHQKEFIVLHILKFPWKSFCILPPWNPLSFTAMEFLFPPVLNVQTLSPAPEQTTGSLPECHVKTFTFIWHPCCMRNTSHRILYLNLYIGRYSLCENRQEMKPTKGIADVSSGEQLMECNNWQHCPWDLIFKKNHIIMKNVKHIQE